jgi:hypothetical protein
MEMEKWISSEIQESIAVKPGITGLWRVTARRDPSFETNMRHDLAYIENWGLSLDIVILLKTVVEVFNGTGSQLHVVPRREMLTRRRSRSGEFSIAALSRGSKKSPSRSGANSCSALSYGPSRIASLDGSLFE